MFKKFFWKEWRESYPVALMPLLTVIGINLYLALRMNETPDFQRNVMSFFVWPGFTILLAFFLFYQERNKETLEFLFSNPIAKHAIWFFKVSCGLIYIVIMCLLSFPGYFIVASSFANISFRSAFLDPYLLMGLCVTISVFSIALFVSTVSTRHRWAFGLVLGAACFAIVVPFAMWAFNPRLEQAFEKLREEPIILSLLILGISPLFLFMSFISFNRKELLDIHRRRAIASYILSICVIFLILNSILTYVKVMGRLPTAGDTIQEVAISPDFRNILLAIREKAHYGRNVFTEERGSIYTIDRDGRNLRKLVTGDCHHVCWSPNGDKISFTKEHGLFKQSFYVMDKDGRNPVKVRTFSVFEGMSWFGLGHTWSPDGSYLAYLGTFTKGGRMIDETVLLFAGWRDCLTVIKVDGSQHFNISFPVLEDAWIFSPVWGEHNAIYFRKSVERRGEYERSEWKVAGGQTEPHQIIAEGVSYFWVSSLGWLAYLSSEEGTDEEEKSELGRDFLTVKNEKGEKVLEASDFFYGWRAGLSYRIAAESPDSRYLTFISGGEKKAKKREMNCNIFDTVTMKQQKVPIGKHTGVRNIEWSPDGDKILFISEGKTEGDFSIYVLSLVEMEAVKIIDLGAVTKGPFAGWIGASEIVYLDANNLWTVSADGSDKKKIFSPGE